VEAKYVAVDAKGVPIFLLDLVEILCPSNNLLLTTHETCLADIKSRQSMLKLLVYF